ncbi:MAG: OmpA family protein [Brevinematales bacterium]|nr:OmpA family protein [Brevinematales bacterium]
MARNKKKSEVTYSTPAWMTTYGDMNSLLLTFFIMLIATMSKNTASTEMQLILSAFKGSLGALEGGNTLTKGPLAEFGNTIESLPSQDLGTKLSKAMKNAEQLLTPEIRAKKVRVQETQKGYKITIASDLFFRPGSAEIDFEEGREVLRKVGLLLKDAGDDVKIEIVGHTDNSPIPKASEMAKIYPTNWELSTARASSVVRYFEALGVKPSRMYAEGRGEHEPLESNDTPEGRAYNRRIDIYVSRME